MKKNSEYTFENNGEFGVIVKRYCGKSDYYPYNPIYNMIEVDVHFDHSTQKIQTFSDSTEEWTYRLIRFEGDNLANWQGREQAINYYIGEEGIVLAEKQVRKNIANMKKDLKQARKNPVYLMLKEIADKQINHYKSDFEYHDCLALYNNNPEKFLWLVRNTGTWILTNKNKWNSEILNYEEKNHESTIYWYNGTNLKEIDIYDAKDLYNRLPNNQA